MLLLFIFHYAFYEQEFVMNTTLTATPENILHRMLHRKMTAPLLLLLTLICCVSAQQTAQQVWYKDYNWHTFYYTPREFKTHEEAVSTIKLIEPQIRSCNPQTGLYRMIDLQVDKYGLMFKTQWSTSQTRYVVNPVTTYGVNAAGMYSNTTYVGRNVTTTDSGLDSHSIIFRNIGNIYLQSCTQSLDYPWRVLINDTSDKAQANIYATDRQTAQDIINSVYTLAKRVEATIMTKGLLGVYCQLITPEQKATLGTDQPEGLVISGVWVDSPAEKAGLQINDIITHIDGNPVKTVQELKIELNKNKKGRVKVSFNRLLNFNEQKNAYDHEKLEKLISLR